jgi:hypothetical protein
MHSDPGILEPSNPFFLFCHVKETAQVKSSGNPKAGYSGFNSMLDDRLFSYQTPMLGASTHEA